MVTEIILRGLWPHGDSKIPGLIAGIVSSAPAVFAKYGITERLIEAHVMAQLSHECGAGTEVVENLNYSADGLVKTWPSRFTRATAVAFAHQPQKIANKVYNGRMGNRAGSDDGWNYRGRGGSQTTGQEGYARLAARTGLDLLGNPDLVNDPTRFLECAVADFINCGCLPFAKRDDIVGVTQHLNGGQIGIGQRRQWLARWKVALAVNAAPAAPADGSLRYGDHGWQVEAVQHQLAALGYPIGAVDGDFGGTTRTAVLGFQAASALPTTGIVDQATKDALTAAPPKPISEERATATADDLRNDGSQTVASADKVTMVGKIVAGGAAAAGADQSGALDKVRDATDQVGMLRSVVETAQDAIQWASSHWWIGAALAGGAVWYFAGDVIKARLEDHRSGANLGR